LSTIRVYRYGLLPPTSGGPLVSDQVHAAHRYQNALVEIDRSRREAVRAILGGHASVEQLGAQVQALVDELAQRRAAIKALR
jgi:hypothetical protein